MQIAQRVLLVVVVIMFFMLGTIMVSGEKEEKIQNQWEHVQAERFLKKICRNEKVSWDEYIFFNSILNYEGNTSEIRIDEYRKEQDLEGEKYFFLLSWEELQEYFYEESIWTFEAGSIIRIEIERQSKGNIEKNVYYGKIPGKE